MVPTMKLTLNEIAQCLDLLPKKVERWIYQGRIPVRKRGKNCIFKKSTLEKWAAAHNLSFALPDKKKEKKQPDTVDSLLAAMKRGGVFHGVEGRDVESVLEVAASQIPGLSIETRQLLYQSLLERERLSSTGIGKGVAIPHPRTPLSERGDQPVLTTYFLKDTIDFDAIDDQPVFVLFVLLSPSTKGHLHLLSRLAFCVRDNAFVSFLKTTPDAEALFSKIAEFEQQLDGTVD